MVRTIVLLLMLLSIAAPLSAPYTTVAQSPDPKLEAVITPPGSSDLKLPRVATFENRVYIGATSGTNTAKVWTKVDSATTFDDVYSFGQLNRGAKIEYSNSSVAVGPDGTIYSAWNSSGDGVYVQARLRNGALGPRRTVLRSGAFRAYVDIGVTTNGTIIVTWDDFSSGSARHVWSVSRDGGQSWSSPTKFIDGDAYYVAAVETGPNNSAIVLHSTSKPFQVYASIWNGNTFKSERITGSGSYANSTGAIGPDGTMYAAYRGVSGGVFYAVRQSNGTWAQSQLAGGNVYGTVAIDVDALNNLHMGWSGDAAGQWDAYYAYKPANGGWKGPIRYSGQAKVIADAGIEASVSDQVYAHLVVERFQADGSMANRYLLYSSPGTLVNINADIAAINSGAASTKSSPVTVTFSNIKGDPTEVRWNWGSAPTDADNDSGGWKPFSNPLSVPLPAGLDPLKDCANLTLYAQVRNSTSADSTPGTDSILFDGSAQADVRTYNPDLSRTLANYNQGATNGASNFTRERTFKLTINDNGDCSGLKEFGKKTSLGSTLLGAWPAGVSTFTQDLMVPADATPGPVAPFSIYVTDKADNRSEFAQTMYYDPRDGGVVGKLNGAPKPTAGNEQNFGSFTVDSNNSILRTLTFSGVKFSDDVYSRATGKPFWGVWLATSPTDKPLTQVDIESPTSTLLWSAVEVPNPGESFSVPYSLFTGLNQPLFGKQGSYYIYAKILDGAGNPSVETLGPVKVTLDPGYSVPTVEIPLIHK